MRQKWLDFAMAAPKDPSQMAKFTKERSKSLSREEAEEYRNQRFSKNESLVKLDQTEKKCIESLMRAVPAGSVVLDVPCGAGRFHPMLKTAGHRVLAADISSEMLDLARAAGLADEYFLADAENIGLPEKSVDGVFCIRLFHHIAAPEMRRRIFKEFARVAKGWVLVSFYHSNCLKRFKKLIRGKPSSGEHVSFSALRAEAAAAGLRVAKTAAVARYLKPQWFALFKVQQVGRGAALDESRG
jgi:ubiquinone/menaquinone biosynthesis C-methylase UbiE